jgi:2-keto-4-pentenoate hydratase/2-oxohepta-3-ene-1,7-dioic acid hydratase in catechol pathway
LPFCTFRLDREPVSRNRVGLVKEDGVVELEEELDAIQYIRLRGSDVPRASRRAHPWKKVVLAPPVLRPGKIIAAIVNTRGMLGGDDVTLDRPRLDMKAPSTVIGPGEKIYAPRKGVRPEVELAAVVGRKLSSVTAAEGKKGIFGYTILNDVTAPIESKEDAYEAYRRDRTNGGIRRTTLRGPLFRSKNHDTFCPLGPWIVFANELSNPGGLKMTTKFRGALVQSGSTSEYIFQPWQIVSYVSRFLTLEPGDLISCGSVGWDREALGPLDPTEYVLPKGEGDLELEVEGIGRLTNPVVPI